jgi:hypothetical protein
LILILFFFLICNAKLCSLLLFVVSSPPSKVPADPSFRCLSPCTVIIVCVPALQLQAADQVTGIT